MASGQQEKLTRNRDPYPLKCRVPTRLWPLLSLHLVSAEVSMFVVGLNTLHRGNLYHRIEGLRIEGLKFCIPS